VPGYYPWIAYYPLVEMLLCSFNAIVFTLLSFLCLRDFRGRRTQWGGYIYPSILVVFAVLFVVHLGTEVVIGLLGRRLLALDIPEVTVNYFIPPLVVHLFYHSEREHLKTSGFWRISVVAFYVVSFVWCVAAVNAVGGFWRAGWPGWPVSVIAFRSLMVGTAAWCGLLFWASRHSNRSQLAMSQRRWLLGLFGAWICVFIIEAFLPFGWNALFEKFLPLGFLFVITYHVERSTFFDILIKRGAFVFASFFLLTMYFVFVPPLLMRLQFVTWIGSLVWALSVWPIVLLAPWGHRKVSAWLDRLWLGRRFSPAQATRYFLSGLQGVISETELAKRAGDHLAEIFRSDAEVSLVPPSETPPEPRGDLVVAPIRLAGELVGEIRIRPRTSDMRFMSEDMALLASLAEGLAFLLENLRLREKRLEQEQKERELRFAASRSELKALRAQVNPHFLFNALNTIAGLIPRRPERAEETIEELAEVFRHTLRRSEREWVRLDEELEAIRAYLHIEQARFGEDFRFRIECDKDAGEIRIPSMIIQTLVENAIKHGIGSLATPGFVDVRVHASEARMRIEVRDNGPGFKERGAKSHEDGGGYGLRNIRERLKGYFGEETALIIGRDEARDMTLVSIDMPRTSLAVATGVAP